jgi:hypothetical protein
MLGMIVAEKRTVRICFEPKGQRAGTEIEERGNTYMVGQQAFLPT